MIINDKICSRCRKTQPLDEFYKNPSTKDNIQNKCKTCYKEISKERYAASIVFLDEMRVGEEGNCDTAIRFATTDAWADTMLYLLANISEDTKSGCYLWEKSKNANGYGRFRIPLPTTPASSFQVKAHRLSFALSYGFDALPLGLTGADNDGSKDTLDHICGVRNCVNALHLQVIPASLNTQLQTEVRVAPKGYGKVIDASFASPSLIAAIENAGVDK